jgi:hypothetical protein
LLTACNAATPPIAQSSPKPSWPAPAIVQVEDHPDSHPHAGLQNADIVFEYLTEGDISRFTAIYFNPSGAGRIEPVRSTRLITLRLQRAYQGLIFTSGASNYVLGQLYRGGYPFILEGTGNGRFFQRDPNRAAPHNLYTTFDQLKDAVQRRHMRIYYKLPAPGEPTQKGTPATHISFNQTKSHGVNYVYSTAERSYEYRWSWNGVNMGPETDTNNGNKPLMVTNAVILFVPHHGMHYTEDVLGAEGIDFTLQGTGTALVFTRGQQIKATWDLTNPNAPLKLIGPDKKNLVLPAGLTWFHLIDPGAPVSVS